MSRNTVDDDQLESLSALIDNHWSDDEVASDVMASLHGHNKASPLLREKFERYHLIRDVIQKEQLSADSSVFSDSVAAAIATEPALQSTSQVVNLNKNSSDDNQLESLSALIDNHWYDDDEGASDVMVGLQGKKPSSPLLREKFERYHLIRDVMQKEQTVADMSGFSDSVAAAIAREPAIVSPAGVLRNRQTSAPSHAGSMQADPIQGDSMQARATEAGGTPEQTSSETDLSSSNVQLLDKARQQKSERAAQKSGGFWSGRVGTGVGGFAIAASAAMVALLGYNLIQQQGVQQNQQQVAEATSIVSPVIDSTTVAVSTNETSIATLTQSVNVQSVLPAASVGGQQALDRFNNGAVGNNIEFVSNTATYWVKNGEVNEARNPALEKRLNQLLGRHIESSPTARLSGMLPYSRLAGYDSPALVGASSTPIAEPGVDINKSSPAGQ